FSENLADLFFLLLRHKFLSIAYVRVVNFNAQKKKKKELKIRKPRCFDYVSLFGFKMSCVIWWFFVHFMMITNRILDVPRFCFADDAILKF
ncbi:MAG: hypothetical protein ACJAVQ_001348, partial [Nonlabens sp.]